MKVITLDPKALSAACLRLEEAARGFAPDLIVGIATGGEEVARRMFADLPHASVRCRRPGSERKDHNPRLFWLIRRLPRPFRDLMRIAEARLLAIRGTRAEERTVEVSPEAARAIAHASRILVVDDAADSGATLAAVLRALGTAKSTAVAVLTVTTAAPAVRPDYTLYDNRTLLRFPWSKDFNPED